MADKVDVTRNEDGGTTRLCTAAALIFKAYRRPYPGSDLDVLTLLASGVYGDGAITMAFAGVSGNPNAYRLMETVPQFGFGLQTVRTADYCSGLGLKGLGGSVTVTTASGDHEVPVEAFS